MKITWLSGAPIQQTGNRLTSDTASVRYRAILPAMALSRAGHQVAVTSVAATSRLEDLLPHLDTEVLVFAKSFLPVNEALTEQARQRGVKVVFDLCDDHFDHPQHGPHQRAMLTLADRVTVSTPAMADIVKQQSGRSATIIDDPMEGPGGLPAFSPRDPLRLLWFGHPSNFDALQEMVVELVDQASDLRTELHIVSAPGLGVEKMCADFNQWDAHIRFRFTPWSLETTWQALQNTDLVLIPSLPRQAKQVKSPNRLVESLWAGRFVVAHPLPAYQDFADWAWIGDDIPAGIRWAQQHPEAALARIMAGRVHVQTHYAPSAIGRQWEAAFRDLLAI